ncbi:phage tail tape measure protein [Clostridium butyricum]|uniref:phage tail tape measure protein n=1 Tax=Clostridium butyricum TaxID=1492 RepID=UPI002AB07CB8|nr:phage tail tape measure protein [Clostridium butyricum]
MADTEQLLVTLGVQNKGADKQISALKRELKSLDKEFKSTSTTTKDFEKTQQGLTTKLSNLNQKYDANKAKLDAYKKKLQEITKAIQEQQEKINNMKMEGKDTAKAEEQLQRMKNTLRDTEQNIRLTENEMQRLNNEISETNTRLQNHALDQYRQQMQQLGESIQNTGQRIQNFGSGMQTAGSTLMKLSAPMVALSGYAVKTSIDFEQAMANLQATSGATGEEFTALENKAKELGENTCKSATDSANAMQYLALAGYDVNTILASTEPVLKASVAWGADMATSADLATDSMSALGMETSRLTEYLDVCSQAQRSSNTTATMLMEAYIGCGGTLKTLGVPLQESATWLGILANQGKKGAEAGNNLNSILVNLVGASSSAKGAMDELGVSAWDQDGNFIGLTNTINLLKTALSKCTQEQKTNFQAAIGGKTQLDTLNMLLAGCGEQYDSLRVKIDGASGATEEMYDIMNDTAQGKIEAFKSKVEALGINIGDKLVPHINDLLDKLMAFIDWFGNLDEGTQSMIVNIGLLTFATGGLLSTTGKVVSGVGSIVSSFGGLVSASGATATSVGTLGGVLGTLSSIAVPLIGTLGLVAAGVYAYNEEQEALNSSVITSKEELGAFKTTLLELNGVHVKSKEELEELGLAYKDLSGNISDDFRKALEDATTDVNTFEVRLKEISLDDVLSEEETTEFTNRVQGTIDSALSAIEGRKEEAQQGMSDLFKFDDGIIDENEQAIIDLCNKEYETEAEEVRKNQDEINNIYNTARTEGRALKPEEIENIKKYYAQIKQIELECKASNNDELQASQIDFNNRIKNLDAQGASELLQQKKKELDEQLIQKQNEYDLIIQKAQEGADKLSGAEKEEAEQRIQNLKDTRDKLAGEYEEQWNKYMDIVEEKAPAIRENVNKYNGEILDDQDLVTQQGLEKMKAHYDGLNQVTQDGWYKIKDTTDGSITDCYMTIDKTTGEITACYNKTTGEVAGYTQDMKNNVKSLADEHEADRLKINQSLGEIAKGHADAAGNIVLEDGRVVQAMSEVTTSMDGTRTAIYNVNGAPMEIKTNADGVVQDMTTVKDKVDAIPKEKSCVLNFIQHGLDSIKSLWSSITNKSVSVDANDTGTYSYSGNGISTVDEKGWELARNNNVQVLGAYNGNTLTNIPRGTGIKTHMQSMQDMKYAISEEMRKQMLNYSNKNNNNNTEIDYNKLASVLFVVFKQGLQGINFETNVNVDADGMITKAVNKSMDKFNRVSKISKVSKGR